MKTAVPIALLALGVAGLAGGSPHEPAQPRLVPLEPGGSFLESRVFKAKDRACVIAVGRQGTAYLGLYVYDQYGNCIVHDDIGNESTKDDTAVEWFPPEAAFYTVEVRNFGLAVNRADVVLR